MISVNKKAILSLTFKPKHDIITVYDEFKERRTAMTTERHSKKRASLFNDSLTLSDSQTKVFNIFFNTMLAATVVSMLAIILVYAYSLAVLHHDPNAEFPLFFLTIFSDFVQVMSFSLADSPYLEGGGSSYPPLAIMILYPFTLICKSVFAKHPSHESMDVAELTSIMEQYPQFWIAFLLFFALCTLSIVLLISKIYKLDLKCTMKMVIIVSFSAPFVYTVLRGNIIYFALIFILIFLLFHDSKSPWLREIALISLALAGTIKIYPLFFGAYLLGKKKIFASCRVAVYFALIFFVSFKFFPGGSNVNPFVENLQGFMSDIERFASVLNLSLTALVYKVISLFSPTAAQGSVFEIVNIVLLALVFVSATVSAVITRSRLSRAIICTAIIVIIPPVSYFYVLIFTIIPFMEYIISFDTLSKKEKWLYGAQLMFLMFTPFLFTLFMLPHALIIMFMLAFEEYKVVKNEMIPWFSKRKLLKKV